MLTTTAVYLALYHALSHCTYNGTSLLYISNPSHPPRLDLHQQRVSTPDCTAGTLRSGGNRTTRVQAASWSVHPVKIMSKIQVSLESWLNYCWIVENTENTVAHAEGISTIILKTASFGLSTTTFGLSTTNVCCSGLNAQVTILLSSQNNSYFSQILRCKLALHNKPISNFGM